MSFFYYFCSEIQFGPIYRQFVGKPHKAIKFLRKKQTGECVNALHRDDIGNISIVWGEVTDPIKHKGYGLSHIPIIVQFGSIKESDSKEEFLFESNYYRIVVEKRFKGREKQWVLTVFDLRKKPRK